MPYNNLPSRDTATNSLEQANHSTGRWRFTFTRGFWVLLILGLLSFMLGVSLSSTFPPSASGKIAISQLLEISGVMAWFFACTVFLLNSSPNIRKRVKSKRSKPVMILAGLGVGVQICGLGWAVIVGRDNSLPMFAFLVGGNLLILISMSLDKSAKKLQK